MEARVFPVVLIMAFAVSGFAQAGTYGGGSGTPEEPYQIATAQQLMELGSTPADYGLCFVLTADINLGSYVFNRALIAPDIDPAAGFQGTPFSGTLDGKDPESGAIHVISNLTIRSSVGRDFLGLVGYDGHYGGSVFRNLRLENIVIEITGAGDWRGGIGGLVGFSSGEISNCHVAGRVSTPKEMQGIGGLAGGFLNNTMSDCSAAVQIIGGKNCGGLIGGADGWIVNCNSAGDISGYGSLGGLIGTLETFAGPSCSVDHCYATGHVKAMGHGSDLLGGLIGWQWVYGDGSNIISNSYATGDVSTEGYSCDYLGGLVGISMDIRNCYATGRVSGGAGSESVGGLSGESRSIAGSYATGDVTTGNSSRYIGGLSGRCRGPISRCFASGNVSVNEGLWNSSSIGGLVGEQTDGLISNCYARGNVTACATDWFIGGLIGNQSEMYSVRRFENCYSTGSVRGGHNVGAVVGRSYGSRANSFWDTKTSGLPQPFPPFYGLTGLNTSQMMTASTFTAAGWDFVGEELNGTQDIWFIREGSEYARFVYEDSRPVAEVNDVIAYAWVDGFVEVRLDGSGSYDADGDAMQYGWYNDANELIATGAEPNVILGAGEHLIHLVVNDGIKDSDWDACTITVVAPAETSAKVLAGTINPKTRNLRIKGRLEFAGTEQPLLDNQQPMLLRVGQSQIEAVTQTFVYSAENARWDLTGEFAVDCGQLAVGENAVMFVGRYASGQWLYGSDSVKLLNKLK